MDTKQILAELRAEQQRIARAISALEALDADHKPTVDNSAAKPTAATTPAKQGRRPMSPAARKRMSEMMKKRWAQRRKTK